MDDVALKNLTVLSFQECIKAIATNIEFSKEYSFYLAMISQCKVDYKILNAPAGVSFTKTHYNLYIGEMFHSLSLCERIGVLKHEMLHILNKHFLRMEDKDPKVWNEATDLAINQLIKREHLPDYGIFISDYKLENKQSSEYYYNELIKNQNQKEQNKFEPNHDIWNESEIIDESILNDVTTNMIETAIEKTNGSSENYFKYLDLFRTKSKVSWRNILKNIIASKRHLKRKTFSRPHRRFSEREDIQGDIKNRKLNLIVLLDVSGSMKDKEILNALNEIQNIANIYNQEIDVIQIDVEIKGLVKFNKKMNKFTRNGNGGTKLFPGIVYIENKKLNPDLVIIITDGYCENIKRWSHFPKFKLLFLGTDRKPPGLEETKYKFFNIKE